MATAWGDFITNQVQGVVRGFTGVGQQPFTPQQYAGGAPSMPNAPRQVTVDTVTGEVKPCRRRRRRRLLTPTDLSDLAALQALVGKGSAALNMAVAKAVRR